MSFYILDYSFVGIFALSFALIIYLVKIKRVSEKYGAFWVVSFLFSGIYLAWYLLLCPEAYKVENRVAFSLLSFVVIPVALQISVMLTVYSQERRNSIQELALLRYDFDESLKQKTFSEEGDKRPITPGA